MELMSGFTSLEEQQAYIERARKMSPSERLREGLERIEAELAAIEAEILKEYPDESEEERKLNFVERMYGKDLADRVRAYLEKRKTV